MKIVELVTKVKKLPKEKIDKLVDSGIEIEDIENLLLNDRQGFKQVLFENQKLKQFLLKQVNSYVLTTFGDIKNNSTLSSLPKSTQKVIENYLKEYFQEGMELEIVSENGRKIVSTIMDLKSKNPIFSKLYKENNVWEKYSDAVRKMANKDMFEMSKEESLQYNKMFAEYFERSVIGTNVPEAEAALKITQREDQNPRAYTAMDFLALNYAKQKSMSPTELEGEDEIFSILLEYELQLKNEGIVKTKIESSLPIKMMEESLKNGKFGENNTLSKKEFIFALKMMKNPGILANDIQKKLDKILSKPDIQADIERRLKEIEKSVCTTLEDIANNKRNIKPEEMRKYSDYLKNYYQISLDRHGDTTEMSKLFCLAMDLGSPDTLYNLVNIEQPETTQFFEKQHKENDVLKKYFQPVMKMANRLQSNEPMTQEEFEKYDNILSEVSYRSNIRSSYNTTIMKSLEKRSKELQAPSKTIEQQIEIYIDACNNNRMLPEHQGFYDAIQGYLSRVLNGSAIEINENRAISHLIRAAQKGILPQDISAKVLNQLEERNKKTVTTRERNTKSLEAYMENAAEIRLQQGRMPSECCDYIIKESILQNRNMTQYSGMVERAFEDFTDYELEKSQINNYLVAVMNQHFFNNESNKGWHTKKMLKLSSQNLEKNKPEELLEIALHEATHAIQDERIAKGQLNRDTYRMLKEDILRNENGSFYKDNYWYMYNEIDARRNSYVKRFQTLMRMGLTKSEIAKLQAGDMKKTVAKYCQEHERGKIKKLGHNEENVNTMFFKLLQEKPELLKQYPTLNVEFEQSGNTVRSRSLAGVLGKYEQMLNQIENENEKRGVSSWCSEILLNGVPISEERMQEELEQLVQFKSDNPIIKAYKNKLLNDKFPRQNVFTATIKDFCKSCSGQKRGIFAGLFERLANRDKQQEANKEGESDRWRN